MDRSRHGPDRRDLRPRRRPAPHLPLPRAANVHQLETRPHRDASPADVRCAEAVGSRLFLELEGIIGANAFWNAAGELHDFAATSGRRLNKGYVMSSLDFYGDTAQRIMSAGPRPDPRAAAVATSTAIISANARIAEAWLAAGSCHQRLTRPDGTQGPVIFCFKYVYDPTSPRHAADLTLTAYGPDGLPFHRQTVRAATTPGEDETVRGTPLTEAPQDGRWAPGVHRIILANETGALALNFAFRAGG